MNKTEARATCGTLPLVSAPIEAIQNCAHASGTFCNPGQSQQRTP